MMHLKRSERIKAEANRRTLLVDLDNKIKKLNSQIGVYKYLIKEYQSIIKVDDLNSSEYSSLLKNIYEFNFDILNMQNELEILKQRKKEVKKQRYV